MQVFVEVSIAKVNQAKQGLRICRRLFKPDILRITELRSTFSLGSGYQVFITDERDRMLVYVSLVTQPKHHSEAIARELETKKTRRYHCY